MPKKTTTKKIENSEDNQLGSAVVKTDKPSKMGEKRKVASDKGESKDKLNEEKIVPENQDVQSKKVQSKKTQPKKVQPKKTQSKKDASVDEGKVKTPNSSGKSVEKKSKNKKTKLSKLKVEIDEKKKAKEVEKTKRRVEKAKNVPIGYFYEVTKSRLGTIEFVEVCQMLNDKFNGRINQSVFYPLAEQSARIFDLNALLFERVIKDSLTYPKIKFAVYVSSKWFLTDFRRARLFEFFKQMKDNVYLVFDSVSLTQTGNFAIDGLKAMAKEFRFKLIFDNAEYQNLSQMISYHPDYIRLDSRFIDKTDENYSLVFRFLRDYCKAQKHKLVVKHVKDDVLKNYLVTNNVDAVQGNGVYRPKTVLTSIISDFKL